MRKILCTLLLSLCSFYSLAQSHIVLVVGAQHSNKAKVSLFKTIAAEHEVVVSHKLESDIATLEQPQALFERYDMVILDAVSKRFTQSTYGKYIPMLAQLDTRLLASAVPDDVKLRRKLSEAQAQTLFDYYSNGGVENLNRMAAYLKHRVFLPSNVSVAEPIIFPAVGIYHPDYDERIFASRQVYLQWLAGRSGSSKPNSGTRVGIMLQRALIETAQTDVVDATIKALEARNIEVLPFFFELSPRVSDYSHLLQSDGETQVDAIVNFRSIHWANQRKAEFTQFGVPVIQALTYFDGDQVAWEQDPQGISASMMPFTLVLPETAGVIDPIIVAAVNAETERAEVIDYQLDFLLDRVVNYTQLKHKPNADKKLVVMVWGDKDIGASFLNVPDSLHTISHRLNEKGYQVEPHEHDYYSSHVETLLNPFYRDYELDQLLAEDRAELLAVSEYRQWLTTLPSDVVAPITAFWGEPETNFMVVERDGEHYFVIPRLRNGNMLVMRQPPRGDSADQDQTLYHTTTVPMNHYYLAAYYYARQQWQADAFIHLGTHGSQEYLPGKERGLSRYDGGNLAVGALPVMYPFIVDDVGEAMQTKRRGAAVVVSHMTPPYAAAGLQGISADIHELMHQHEALDDGGVKQKTAAQIAQTCLDENLCKDFGWDRAAIDADFEQFLVVLHDYLGELAAQNQPLGLHSFGELPRQQLVISTISQMLGKDFQQAAATFEQHHYRHDHPNHKNEAADHNDKDTHSHSHEHQTEGHYHEVNAELEALAGFKTVRDFVVGQAGTKPLNKTLTEFVALGKEHYENLSNIKELDNLLAGLAGQYIAAKTGGDPIRHPESLPTGLNLYGFDPARLPTKAAYAQGEELVETLIAEHYQEHGEYPDKLAFSLWSIEAMRHYGVLEAQALKAMGVRPVWSDDGRVVDTEIIPAAELKRPRVDIVLSATGLYRDAFPNVMQRLATAIAQVAALKEANNSLWDNSQRIQQQLIDEGVEADEAQYLSTVRIFSSGSGQYGSGVDGPVFNSDTWESDVKIADNYLAKMGYYFGADASRWGKQFDGLYAKQLSGTDIVAFSRSSNLYGMITSDDPFEYFGSIAMAVRNIDGVSPKMMISNLRDANNAKMETAASFMAKELHTRNFNKRWLQEMQKEGYSGAVAVSSAVANFWGWQVVDPNVVRADQWQTFYEVYVNDKLEVDVNEWFEQVNPAAQAMLIERMLEAVRKDYWQADASTLQHMVERYNQLIEQYDVVIDNEKLREFVNTQAAGFGLDLQLPADQVLGANTASQQVQGQQLNKVEPSASSSQDSKTLLLLLLACFVIIAFGAIRQARR